MDAAEAVCGREPIGVSEVIDHVTALTTKSLVQSDDASGATRYRLLETVRHYAADQLMLAEELVLGRRDDHNDAGPVLDRLRRLSL